ncbi:uncharacterized protein LOC110442554 [Mizuhopecten yessoensis]|uniref:uncharacterized protein LOC110442554 n=1 Tax=Mizuhopecten yessoensis TaxID=6573 RepID=UPI000B45F87E|nr:uncharacterized protein LOC110442554 [Mizuhopecten yessoensis]
MKMNEFQRKSGAQKLRSEYHMKSRRLAELKGDVSIIKMEMYKSKDQECLSDSGIRSPSLEKAVGWRKRLHQVTTHLQNVHLDDSQEHSYLKQLQRHVQLSLVNASPHHTELYDLVSFVADLNLMHENLCAVKEEIENEINTALRALAKAYMHLTAECGMSEDGDSTDYMTHFVKQHVSPSRRKVPFQDLTNMSFSHHSVSHDQPSTRSILSSDGVSSDVSTIPWLSQIEAHTSGSTIQCCKNIHDSATREVDCEGDVVKGMREMYKEKVLLSNANYIHVVQNHNSEDEENTAGVGRINKNEAIRSFGSSSQIDSTPDVSTGATICPGFDNNNLVKAGQGFSIGVECRYHGSSCGKIKISHFSTPSTTACNKVRNLAHIDLQNPACYSQKGLCCNNKGRPVCDTNRNPFFNSPDKPMVDNCPGIHALASMESAAMTLEVEPVMNIPYIDDDFF